MVNKLLHILAFSETDMRNEWSSVRTAILSALSDSTVPKIGNSTSDNHTQQQKEEKKKGARVWDHPTK